MAQATYRSLPWATGNLPATYRPVTGGLPTGFPSVGLPATAVAGVRPSPGAANQLRLVRLLY